MSNAGGGRWPARRFCPHPFHMRVRTTGTLEKTLAAEWMKNAGSPISGSDLCPGSPVELLADSGTVVAENPVTFIAP